MGYHSSADATATLWEYSKFSFHYSIAGHWFGIVVHLAKIDVMLIMMDCLLPVVPWYSRS